MSVSAVQVENNKSVEKKMKEKDDEHQKIKNKLKDKIIELEKENKKKTGQLKENTCQLNDVLQSNKLLQGKFDDKVQEIESYRKELLFHHEEDRKALEMSLSRSSRRKKFLE